VIVVKRILILGFLVMLLVPGVLAAQGGQAGPQNGGGQDGSPVAQPGGPPDDGAGQPDGGPPGPVQERRQIHEQLREEIRLWQENVSGAGEPPGHQNAVRLAVHTFLALGEMDGGIGHNVSVIARQFNTSVQATSRAEERIRERDQLMILFFGGDREAAGILLQQTSENQQRIQEMEQLIATCTCSNETKAILEEQLRTLGQEQARLRTLALQEQNQTGLFGWLWR